MGWLILHPPCFLGFFLASGSGAVDGRDGAFAFRTRDEDEEDVGCAIDFSIACSLLQWLSSAFDQLLAVRESVRLRSC